MNISAVTVCVGYSDFLSWSLPTAKHNFDSLVVVTTPEDKKTQDVCRYHYVECLTTDIFYENGATFNKGKGIALGVEFLDPQDFCVTFDADICFPPRFSEFIRSRNYDKDAIYGIDRLDVKDWDTWISFLCNPIPQHYVGSTWASGFPVMYRVSQGLNFSPVGFYQQWHMKSKYYKGYPKDSDNAAESDLKFSLSWPSDKRILIPEVYLYHLSSEPCEIGKNWAGRKTKIFGPNQ